MVIKVLKIHWSGHASMIRLSSVAGLAMLRKKNAVPKTMSQITMINVNVPTLISVSLMSLMKKEVTSNKRSQSISLYHVRASEMAAITFY